MRMQDEIMQKDCDLEAGETEVPLLESSIIEKTEKNFLKYVDILLSSTVMCFLVVSCWRGTWTLMDIYGAYFPQYESFTVGYFVHFIFAMCQRFFHDLLIERESNNKLTKYFNWIIHKVYFMVFYVSVILSWRSINMIFNDLCGLTDETKQGDFSVIVATIVTILMCTVLMYVGAMKNVNSIPMTVNTDTKAEFFLFNDRFFKMGEKTSLYVLDCLFSIVIVGTLVVFVWRGVWLLVDIFLFPQDEVLSSWSSLILGYFSVAMAFLLQPVMRYLCERLTGAARLLLADLFILFALFGTVNVWRGIWNLLNIYFLPDNLELSCWITHWVSLIILILCRCSNSLLVRGVYIDAEEPGGECANFPCYYLRVILRKKKLKKLNLNAFTLNDTIKVNQKEGDLSHNNHVVNINTVSGNVEENNDFKPVK